MAMVKHRNELPITSSNGFKIVWIALLSLELLPNITKAQRYIEASGGGVYNVPMPLSIYQDGRQTIRMTAQFESESFTLPVYWDIKLGRTAGQRIFEAELIHHKLYLKNTNSDVQKFNISHGFNMLIFSYGIVKHHYRYKLGLGLVIAHPESEISGLEFGNSTDDWDMGYYLTGPIVSAGVDRQIKLSKIIYLAIGAKTTVAFAKVPINSGHARFVNVAGHLNLGFGLRI